MLKALEITKKLMTGKPYMILAKLIKEHVSRHGQMSRVSEKPLNLHFVFNIWLSGSINM